MKIRNVILGMAAVSMFAVSCDDDDNDNPVKKVADAITKANINLNISGLEDLGSDFVYEGWIIVDGQAPISTGRFSDPAKKVLEADKAQLALAKSFVLSIEPANEEGQALIDPAPTKIIKADFDGNTAPVGFGTINADFADISKAELSGKFFLRTPTDDADGVAKNDEAGVWFGTPAMPAPKATLELPVLAANSGWKYEGWVVVKGVPYSTGTFLDPKAADENAADSKFKGTERNGPPIPGEDFINNLEGTGFANGADLRGAKVVISLEPSPDDNVKKPFVLKPLAGDAGQETAPTAYDFAENFGSFPTGTVTR